MAPLLLIAQSDTRANPQFDAPGMRRREGLGALDPIAVPLLGDGRERRDASCCFIAEEQRH